MDHLGVGRLIISTVFIGIDAKKIYQPHKPDVSGIPAVI
jgi:hypothetical protein